MRSNQYFFLSKRLIFVVIVGYPLLSLSSAQERFNNCIVSNVGTISELENLMNQGPIQCFFQDGKVVKKRTRVVDVNDLVNFFGKENKESVKRCLILPLISCAICNKNAVVLDFLISLGADLYAISSEGKTPLCYAVEQSTNQNAHLLKTLLDFDVMPINREERDYLSELMHQRKKYLAISLFIKYGIIHP